MATEFTVSNMVHLREIPDGDIPSPLGIVDHGDVVTILTEQGQWSKVRVTDRTGKVREGFVPTDMIEKLPPPAPKEAIDEVNFALALTYVARTYGVNRDYLIAVAWAESRIKNVMNQTTGAVGPFQFTPTTWAGLVARHLQQEGITERDIVDAGNQAVFAAIYTAEAQDQLLRELKRLPTGAELYVAHRLGLPAALAVLSTDRAVSIDRVLLPAFQAQENAEGAVRGLVDTHKDLLKEGDSIRTVEQALASATARLNEGLREAARIVANLPEDEQFAPRLEGEAGAPWMIIAQQELSRGVIEDKRTGQSNPRIEDYHAATRGGRRSDDTPWCAAFVSFCMEKSGNELVASKNLRSALAADWLKWGMTIAEPIWGAVCVLHPLVRDSSGHVGFLTASDATTVTLLGGNQGDSKGNESVNERKFSKGDVRSYRWLDVLLDGTTVPPGGPPLPSPAPSPVGTARPSVQRRETAIDTLARTLWGEARGEPRLGKEAVAAVVLNRLRRNAPGRFGATVEEVCRKPQQFSCWNRNDPNRAQLERVDRSNAAFTECLGVAEQAVDGRLSDPTIGADHYHTTGVSPSWSRGKTPCRTIGRHLFFNNIP